MGKSPRLGLRSPVPDSEEEYELPTMSPTDPLLPSYSDNVSGGMGDSDKSHATGSRRSRSGANHIRFAPLPSSSGSLSTHAETLRLRRKSRLGRVLLCTWATVVPLFLGLALLGSWVGRDTLTQLRNWDAWDSVPQDVKDWLETVVPVKQEQDLGAFPTDIGYAGPTPTGKEAALLATAPYLPKVTPLSPLVPPKSPKKFHIPSHWGNLSPYHSVSSHGLPDSSPLIPADCKLDELHWLQRHGARYPTSSPGGPEDFADRLKQAKETEGWRVKGELKWLQDWEYKLGREVLTPFGRSQLYNLGVAARIKYGFLLDKMGGRLPVFRTETQDRMLKSAQNFAAGFFGIPVENQYQLEVQIEAPGFNTTLAPWNMCARENATAPHWSAKLDTYDETFTIPARTRLNRLISGYSFTGKDVRSMMDMCAYESVALGYSSFCDLFDKDDWKGYSYRNALMWYYYASFGQPVARAQGVGWVQELVARLTHTPITEHNTTTNSTLHDSLHFPTRDPLYVDFTHDTLFALLLPTMNLTSFASGIDFDAGEELPWDKPPKHHSFIAESIMPFATNMQVQVMTCGVAEGAEGNEAEDGGEEEDDWEGEREEGEDQEQIGVLAQSNNVKRGWWPFGGSAEDDDDDEDGDDNADSPDSTPYSSSKNKHKSPPTAGRYIRIVLNDAVVPLTGINGCEEDDDGKCAFGAFVDGMKEVIGRVDFAKDCGAREKEGDHEPEQQQEGEGQEQSQEEQEEQDGEDGEDGEETGGADGEVADGDDEQQ